MVTRDISNTWEALDEGVGGSVRELVYRKIDGEPYTVKVVRTVRLGVK